MCDETGRPNHPRTDFTIFTLLPSLLPALPCGNWAYLSHMAKVILTFFITLGKQKFQCWEKKQIKEQSRTYETPFVTM